MAHGNDLAAEAAEFIELFTEQNLSTLDFDHLTHWLTSAAATLAQHESSTSELALLHDDYRARIAGMLKAIAVAERTHKHRNLSSTWPNRCNRCLLLSSSAPIAKPPPVSAITSPAPSPSPSRHPHIRRAGSRAAQRRQDPASRCTTGSCHLLPCRNWLLPLAVSAGIRDSYQLRADRYP